MNTILKSLAILFAALWLLSHIIEAAFAHDQDTPIPQPSGCTITEVREDHSAVAYCEYNDSLLYYVQSPDPVCADIQLVGWLTRKEYSGNYQACFYEYLAKSRSYAVAPHED